MDVDVANSKTLDINGAAPMCELLLWAAAKGKIADMIGNPPEVTWTSSLTPMRGPKAVHQRTKDHPFGVPGLPVSTTED